MAAASRSSDRSAVLLGSGGPVRKALVGGYVIKLCGRLVVPGAPGCGAVLADDGALIAAQDHSIRIVGVDPQLMIVVTARRALYCGPVLAGIGGSIDRRVRDINGIGVLGIG